MLEEVLLQAIDPQAVDVDDSAHLKRLKVKVSGGVIRLQVINLLLVRQHRVGRSI